MDCGEADASVFERRMACIRGRDSVLDSLGDGGEALMKYFGWPSVSAEKVLRSDIENLRVEIRAAFEDLRQKLGMNLMSPEAITRLGYKGDESNELYKGYVGGEKALSVDLAAIPFSSTLCQQIHFSLDQYRFWVKQMKERPKFLRKQWEFVYIAQALNERGFLSPGKKGLGFGVGLEPLPALFASFGCQILATDQSIESAIQAGWARSHQHSIDLSRLNGRGICTDRMFEELVGFAAVDMNAISPEFENSFDFCWSACSLEHLGSLRHGIDFIKTSIGTLRPGGVAIHTTEFNLSSDEQTIESPGLSIYRRRDVDALVVELEAAGHNVSPVDWTRGLGWAETVVDLPPYGRGEPHVRLRIGDYDCTSIGLIITKGAAA
jgi:SAM-dependent methyltransferase